MTHQTGPKKSSNAASAASLLWRPTAKQPRGAQGDTDHGCPCGRSRGDPADDDVREVMLEKTEEEAEPLRVELALANNLPEQQEPQRKIPGSHQHERHVGPHPRPERPAPTDDQQVPGCKRANHRDRRLLREERDEQHRERECVERRRTGAAIPPARKCPEGRHVEECRHRIDAACDPGDALAVYRQQDEDSRGQRRSRQRQPGNCQRNRQHHQPVRGVKRDIQRVVKKRRSGSTECGQLIRHGGKRPDFVRHMSPDLVHPGRHEPPRKVGGRLARKQLDDAEVVPHEVIVDGRDIRNDRAEAHDQRGERDEVPPVPQIDAVHRRRYLTMRPIIRSPVRRAPVKLPVIFDSPTRPR